MSDVNGNGGGQGAKLAQLGKRMLELTEEIQELYLLDEVPWVIGYSGGKDSTAILQLVWWALRKIPEEKRHKTVHVISTDTMVEQPVVSTWVRKSLARMRVAAAEHKLPIEPHELTPQISQTFWVNLIGRGYPAPRHKFRWCTERLKINPSNKFIREVVRTRGEAILVLGTRKAESTRRAANMARYEAKRVRDRLSPNGKLPNCLVFTPIEEWTNDDVWMYLMQVQNPWGHSNRDLLSMYRGASADNECPLVVDTSSPSCGNSRFGCWICTMVEEDRSMMAMIQNDEEKEWMAPLLQLRNELAEKPDKHRRDWRRLNGRVQLFNNAPIHGPYTKKWREYWLERVLTIQTELRTTGPEQARDIELIRLEELYEIRRIWREEKHEFDDSLPEIYKRATGEDFPESRIGTVGLGRLEWEVLEEVCGGDELLLDLCAHLLDTEQQYRTMSRRVGVYNALESILLQRGYASKEEAVQHAEAQAQLKVALKTQDTGEQLSLLKDIVRPEVAQ